ELCGRGGFAAKQIAGGGLEARPDTRAFAAEVRRADLKAGPPALAPEVQTGGLSWLPRSLNGSRSHTITLVNTTGSPLRVDSLSMGGAYEAGDTVAFAFGGRAYLGVREAPARVRSSVVGNVTAAFQGSGASYAAARGETLIVYPPANNATEYLLVETAGADSANSATASGIEVQLPGLAGWTAA